MRVSSCFQAHCATNLTALLVLGFAFLAIAVPIVPKEGGVIQDVKEEEGLLENAFTGQVPAGPVYNDVGMVPFDYENPLAEDILASAREHGLTSLQS